VSATRYLDYLHLSDLTAFVVAAENRDSVREANLERDKEGHSLDTVVATIDIVTHEQVVGVGRLSTDLKELEQIMELTMDITANRHRCAHLLNV